MLGLLRRGRGPAERQKYLARTPADKGHGAYPRSRKLGSLPLHIAVPRTRNGTFRPRLLPPAYQRDDPEQTPALLLASSRSRNAAKTAPRRLGLAAAEQDLDSVAHEFLEELPLRHSRPLDPDLPALLLDAPYVEVQEADRLRPGAISRVVGRGRDGNKPVLASIVRCGRENRQDGKLVWRGLLERGWRRVLLVLPDDFSGLRPITQSLFPQADLPLWIVPRQRNAQSHLSQTAAPAFPQRMRALKPAWNQQVARAPFEDLCQRFHSAFPSCIAEIRQKRDPYRAFLNSPDSIRRSLSTTPVVEAVPGQLAILRRNSGGYFPSDPTLPLQLGIAVAQRESGRWRCAASSVSNALDPCNLIFQARFESES